VFAAMVCLGLPPVVPRYTLNDVLPNFQVSTFVADMVNTPEYCQPQVILLFEIYSEETAQILFPVNILRNYARVQVKWLLACASFSTFNHPINQSTN
jgi:hypothetical protein